jgi:hypothetical protein
MSEHRSPRGKRGAAIIPFPCHDDEEEDWPPEIIEKWMERAEHVHKYVESGYLPIDAVLRVQREMFEMLTLYWAGLPPRKADEFVQRLAPWWAELTTLMAGNRQKAKAMLAMREGGSMPK